MIRSWLSLSGYHWTIVFLAGGLFAGLLAWNSFDLVRIGMANFIFVKSHGWIALREGGFIQMVEIAVRGYLSFAFYIGLKAAEVELVYRWRSIR